MKYSIRKMYRQNKYKFQMSEYLYRIQLLDVILRTYL